MSFYSVFASFLLAVWFCIYTHAQLRILKFQDSVFQKSELCVHHIARSFFKKIFKSFFIKFFKTFSTKSSKHNFQQYLQNILNKIIQIFTLASCLVVKSTKAKPRCDPVPAIFFGKRTDLMSPKEL